MPAGRPNRPLFDLIAEESADARKRSPAAASTANAQATSVEMKPAPSRRLPDPPEAAPASHDFARPAAIPARTPRGLWASLLSHGRASVEVTTPWLAATMAILLAVALGVWVIAYKMGESEASSRLAGGIGTAPPKSESKTNEPPTAQDTPRESSPQGPQVADSNGERTPPANTEPSTPQTNNAIEGLAPANPTDAGAVVAYAGSYENDPRTPGKNYLLLASSMSRQDVREAVDFLGRNGFMALGVPYGAVDRRGREGKNDPLYKLVSAQGFDSSDMKESQNRREAIEEEAGKLGQIYQRQHRGKYNFAKVNWEKFVR